MRNAWRLLSIAALGWTAALLHRGWPLAVDEIEFFRATKWIGNGLLPFRDFWEHHTPLQWILFAPVARFFGQGPGVEAVLAMRWAQLALWIAIFALLVRLTRRSGIDPWPALVLLLLSTTFVRKAIEYRIDVPANLAYLGALALIAFGATRRRWIGFGALMSLAVLFNMRMMPLVVITAIVALWYVASYVGPAPSRPESRLPAGTPSREPAGWKPAQRPAGSLPHVALGVLAIAALFIGSLVLAGIWPQFRADVIGYNVDSSGVLQVHTFFDALLLPFWTLDLAGIAFMLAAAAGIVLALRDFRERGPLQFFSVLVVAALTTIASMHVQYDYHFQHAYLLMLPPAALALEKLRRPAWQALAATVAGVALLIAVLQAAPTFGAEMEYQDAVMTAADKLTAPGETVLDGAGYALRRTPAYRYWFLPHGVRALAAKRRFDQYDLRDITAAPPAAIIYDYRLALYLQNFPDVARYATTHYVPVYRNLWVPGMTATAGPAPRRLTWIAPRAGQYQVYASELLTKHPWLTNPLGYAALEGPAATRYAIPLAQLPPASPESMQWTVDGIPQPPGVKTLVLRKGARVDLLASPPRATGILLVPRGIGKLCIATAEEQVF
jgi:hypothetical protein